MTKRSDDFEKSITSIVEKHAPHLTVNHVGGNVNYPDIFISDGDVSTHIEVKMTGAQFGTPRLKYENNKWCGVEDNDITNSISDILNSNPLVYTIENLLKDTSNKTWIGYKRTHYTAYKQYENTNVLTDHNIPYMIEFNSVVNTLKSVLGHQTVLWYGDCDEESKHLIDIVSNYYINKGANYMQIGDNYYTLNDVYSDKLKLHDNIPNIKADAKLTVRFTIRRTHQWIEIIPTIKFLNIDPSPYSLKNGSRKLIPFKQD